MRAKKIDANQPEIVKALRQIPGVTVELDRDDIMVGYKGVNYWYEIKTPDTVSSKTGMVRMSEITDIEKKRFEIWTGHYEIVWTLDQILEDMGIATRP